MLNTKKLLYILPDVAYVAELLPAKKEHTFSIQSFRQINGEYLDDNEFIAENLVKLLAKIEAEDYFLILPDFLFTNTIIDIEETSESKITEYMTHDLLPELGISSDTHELETFVLTEFKGTSKVQLSAIEKQVLGPIRAAADNAGVTIEGLAPLSWTTKAVISLEPSISVLQIGQQLYSSKHYIGIDQTTIAEVSEVKAIAETIKTLKGAEQSIQTVYLLVNDVVEEKLNDELNDVVPLQQLADSDNQDSKMPSYVKMVIEAGMQTLSIEDYPVPIFELGKASDEEKEAFITESVEELEKSSESEEDEEGQEKAEEKSLPKPATATATKVEEKEESAKKEKQKTKDQETDKDDQQDKTSKAGLATGAAATATTSGAAASKAAAQSTAASQVADDKTADSAAETTDQKPADQEDEVDLSKFTQAKAKSKPDEPSQPAKPEKTTSSAQPSKTKKSKKVIKNTSGIGNMLKMVFLTLAVFAATVAIGIGVGLGLLSVTNNDTAQTPTPTPTMEATPTPTPTPTATPEPINNQDYSILVTNATTIAGYAGETAASLEEAEFGTVTASNATEEYEPGLYVLMEEEDQALIAALEEATDLELTYLDEVDPSQEDPDGSYDAVIVLAEGS